jgi:RNA polymerase sigma-70 factor (ECF subfamily)
MSDEPEPDDAELVARALGGDRAAIAALLRRHGAVIRGAVSANTPAHLKAAILYEDVEHELFGILIGSLPNYDRAKGEFATWLGAVTRYEVWDMVRSFDRIVGGGSGSSSTSDDDFFVNFSLSKDPDPAREARRAEDQKTIQNVLALLTPDERDLLMRRYVDKVPLKTMAKEMGVKVTTLSMRLQRVKKKCRELLGPRNKYLTTEPPKDDRP